MKKAKNKNIRGQAIVEYILMVVVTLSVVAVLSFGLKKVLFRFWMEVTCDISKPCPHCVTSEQIKTAANQVSPNACK